MLRVRVVLSVIALTMAASACGSSSRGGSSSPSTVGNASGSVTTTPVGGSSLRVTPGFARAFRLLDKRALTAALDEPVTGVEDDGGVPLSQGRTGHISWARAVTKSGVTLAITLQTFDSVNAATSAFRLASSAAQGTAAVKSAADQAAYANGEAWVRRGAQVLDVKASTAGAAQRHLDQVKISGGDPTQLQTRYQESARTAAVAIAPKLAGTADAAASTEVPAGGVDPCLFRPASLATSLLGSPVSTSYVQSDHPPALTCEYSASGGATIDVSVVTQTQLQDALAPTTLAAALTADEQTAAGQTGTLTKPFGDGTWLSIDPDGALDSAGWLNDHPTRDEAIDIYQNPSQATRADCEKFFSDFPPDAAMPSEPGPGPQMLALADYCTKLLAQKHESTRP